MKAVRCVILLVICMLTAVPAVAQKRYMNDKVLNKPYADMRPWHLGFSIGMHTQNLLFTHNGYIGPNGEEWQVEEPGYDPGFCVNGVVAFRLSNYFSLRFNPGLYFGNRSLKFLNHTTGEEQRQSLKATYVVLPFDVIYSAQRLRNFRPYMTAGVMPAFDVAKKQEDYLQLKSTDFFLSVGFGFDFYLPYFKFIPELKFCFGLGDVLKHDRPDLEDDPLKLPVTQSLKKATSRMIVLTFYFE
ncbi:MAG: PorT family protein [Bacteroidales bacterium]|nr:PorT family protein [Bacteroidales bacterium]